MNRQPDDPLSRLIGPVNLELLGRAVAAGRLATTTVVSDGVLNALNRDQVGVILGGDGSVIILVTDRALRAAYGAAGEAQP